MAAAEGVFRPKQGFGLQQPFVNTVFMEASVTPLAIEGPRPLHPYVQVALPGVAHGTVYLRAVAARRIGRVPSAGFGVRYRPVGASRRHRNGVGCAINRGLGKLGFHGTVGKQMFYRLVDTDWATKLFSISGKLDGSGHHCFGQTEQLRGVAQRPAIE